MTETLLVAFIAVSTFAALFLISYRSDKAWKKYHDAEMEEFRKLPQSQKDAWAKDMLDRLRQERRR